MTHTFEEVLAAARAVIAEKGEDFVYSREDCVYRERDGSASCVVGRILDRIGVDMDAVFPFNDTHRTGFECNTMRIYLVDRLDILAIDEKACNFLSILQEEQDDEKPWGTCLNLALEGLEWCAP